MWRYSILFRYINKINIDEGESISKWERKEKCWTGTRCEWETGHSTRHMDEFYQFHLSFPLYHTHQRSAISYKKEMGKVWLDLAFVYRRYICRSSIYSIIMSSTFIYYCVAGNGIFMFDRIGNVQYSMFQFTVVKERRKNTFTHIWRLAELS